MDILNGTLRFFTVVVLYNYGESLLFKFNLRTCFVFDLLEYCAHDIYTLSIQTIIFYYLKVKQTLFFNIVT